MLDILTLPLPFFGLIAIGYALARLKPAGFEAMGWLNSFILYAALPALFFKLMSRTPFEQLTRFDFILTDLAATYGVFVAMLLIARFALKASLPESTVQAFGAAYGNIGYMGPGLALLALGDKAAVPVALIVCLENAMHFIAAPALMAMERGATGPLHRTAGRIIGRVAIHPFILSSAAGFLAAGTGFSAPEPLSRLIDMLAAAAAPCALFAMGVTLALRPLKRVPRELALILPAKLLIHPAVMLAAMTLAGPFDPVWVETAVLLAALPTAANVFVIGQQYGVWQERASATILISTIASIGSLTLVLYLLRGL